MLMVLMDLLKTESTIMTKIWGKQVSFHHILKANRILIELQIHLTFMTVEDFSNFRIMQDRMWTKPSEIRETILSKLNSFHWGNHQDQMTKIID